MSNTKPYTLVEIEEIGILSKGSQIAYKSLYQRLDSTLEVFYPEFSSEEYYYHHGVYLGDCRVVHFAGANQKDAKPCECDIFQFWKGATDGKLYRVEYDDDVKKLPVQETMRYAEEVLKTASTWPGFQTIYNNCESFSTWLKTGESQRAEGKSAKIRIIPLAAAVVGAVASSSAVASIAIRR